MLLKNNNTLLEEYQFNPVQMDMHLEDVHRKKRAPKEARFRFTADRTGLNDSPIHFSPDHIRLSPRTQLQRLTWFHFRAKTLKKLRSRARNFLQY